MKPSDVTMDVLKHSIRKRLTFIRDVRRSYETNQSEVPYAETFIYDDLLDFIIEFENRTGEPFTRAIEED